LTEEIEEDFYPFGGGGDRHHGRQEDGWKETGGTYERPDLTRPIRLWQPTGLRLSLPYLAVSFPFPCPHSFVPPHFPFPFAASDRSVSRRRRILGSTPARYRSGYHSGSQLGV
jgi:hypothetical protein